MNEPDWSDILFHVVGVLTVSYALIYLFGKLIGAL